MVIFSTYLVFCASSVAFLICLPMHTHTLLLTFEPAVQCHIHHVLHDGQELGGEQRVVAVVGPPLHPAVPQLHHQTHLPQGEGLEQIPPTQSPHRLGDSSEHRVTYRHMGRREIVLDSLAFKVRLR